VANGQGLTEIAGDLSQLLLPAKKNYNILGTKLAFAAILDAFEKGEFRPSNDALNVPVLTVSDSARITRDLPTSFFKNP